MRLPCLLMLLLALAMPATAASRPVTVFAAASLKESLDAVSAEWMHRSGERVVISYAASSALAKQIEQGAPADVFISADREWMDYLQARKLIDLRTRANLVGNELVLIAPTNSPTRAVDLRSADSLLKALGDGRLAVAETAGVPAGRYAKQSLLALRQWDAVSARLAQADNVRAAMSFVARGEAPLGIVYATDVRAEPKVRVVAVFPPASHERIIYPVARVAGSTGTPTVGFMAFLRSRAARRTFASAGFTAP